MTDGRSLVDWGWHGSRAERNSKRVIAKGHKETFGSRNQARVSSLLAEGDFMSLYSKYVQFIVCELQLYKGIFKTSSELYKRTDNHQHTDGSQQPINMSMKTGKENM